MAGRNEGRGLGRVLADALVGAVSGIAASWVMEKAQSRIMAVGSEETKQREKEAQGDLEPATVRVAERAAQLAGRSLPDDRRETAAEAVHYATGAAFGAIFGVVAGRIGASALALGAAYGVVVWLFNDEALVPALGFSKKPWQYPASTHAKALVSHLVYGTATGAGVRILGATLH